MKNFKRKASGKKLGLNQSDDQKLKVVQSGQISKKGLKRSHDEEEQTLQSSTKKMKLMNDPKELQNNKLKPTTKQNLKSNKVFKEATNGQKSLSKAKKGKIVEQLDEESDEEMIGNDSVDSNDEMYYSLNVSNKSNDSDDDDDVNESEDDEEEEDEGEDSGDEEEDDNDREEMDDDDIVEAINKKVSRSKKKVKIDDEDDDNSDEDDDNSDEDDDNSDEDDANSDEDDDNSDEGSSDDSSDDEEDESSSSSSSSEEEEEEFETVPWGELTADAPKTEEATSRLALCNMDWNHVKAVDVLVVLNSFKPASGSIKNVKIYPSEFGLERMKIEEEEGPLKLIGHSKDEDAQLINLRKYEMEKLKYYYAVVTCDSAETADAIYKACDGMEFLKSGVVIDLRFIPEDMTFDQKPTSVAKSMPLEGTYEPPEFENKALHCTDVTLTWDETPVDRVNAFKGWDEDLGLEEFEARLKDYIAPPSDEEDEEDDNDDADEIKKPKKRPFQDTIALYRNLLKDIDDKEKEEDDERQEKEETEKKFLEALGGSTWLTQKKNISANNGKKSEKDEEEDEDDSTDNDGDGEESGSEESETEEDEAEEEDEEEEEEEVKLPVKGKKVSNRKLVKMKIKEKKKQKMSDKVLPTTQADRFKKLMNNKDFALDEKVADKTTKLKQRRIFSDMKKKHGR